MKKISLTLLSIALVTSMGFAQEDTKKEESKVDMNALKEMMKGGSIPGMGGTIPTMQPVEVEDEYQFQHSVDMKVETFNKKGDQDNSMNYTMHLSEDADRFGMEMTHEQGTGTIIYELNDQRMIMMTGSGDSKMGFVMVVNETMVENATEERDPDFHKSGKTKEIQGRQCEEWVGSDDGHDLSVWMATDAPFSFAKAYQEMAKAQNKGKGSGKEYPEGMLMEMISTDKESGTKTVMTVTEIRENSDFTISTKGWTFYEMGAH